MHQTAREAARKEIKAEQRKCKNCAIRYTPAKADQKFCSDQCRYDFHKHGRLTRTKITDVMERQGRAVARDLFRAVVREELPAIVRAELKRLREENAIS